MGNLLSIIVIGASIAFAIFVIYKLIRVGISDRKEYDNEQKNIIENPNKLPTKEKKYEE
jgi:hypothetical protein